MIDWLLTVLERRRKRKAALRYNRVNTFRHRDGSWMCPTCCLIHRPLGPVGKFTGPHFPACCEFAAGGRLGKRYATFS